VARFEGPAEGLADLVDRVHDQLVTISAPRRDDVVAAIEAQGRGMAAEVRLAAVDEVLGRLSGLGGLRRVIDDDDVSDVLINGPGNIVVERLGRLEVAGSISSVELDRLVEYLLGPTGRRVDRRSPVVDVRLDDRTRCHIAVPPVAVNGPCVSLRRFPARPRALDEFAAGWHLRQLEEVVRDRRSVLIYGPTGSGKTSLLAALLACVAGSERVVVIEEAAELPLRGSHVVRLEAQPPNLDGHGGVSSAALVAAALRMRPDRLVVGEVRGVEAAGFVHALSTGHRGSMGTVHADTPDGAIWRVEQLALGAGAVGEVGAHLRRVIDIAIGMRRCSSGARHVHRIDEVAAP